MEASVKELELLLVPNGQIVQVPLSQLHEHPLNHDIYGDEEIDAQLLDDIRERGVTHALHILPDGRVVCGHRRRRCAIICGFSTVPCVVRHDLPTKALVEWELIQSNRLTRTRTTLQRAREVNHLVSLIGAVRATDRLRNGESVIDSIDISRAERISGIPEAELAQIRDIIQAHQSAKKEDALSVAARYYGKSRNAYAPAVGVVNTINDLRKKGYIKEAAELGDALNVSLRSAVKLAKSHRLVTKGKDKVFRNLSTAEKMLEECKQILLNIRASVDIEGERIIVSIVKDLPKILPHVITADKINEREARELALQEKADEELKKRQAEQSAEQPAAGDS